MKKLILLINTVRYLKLRQIFGRLRFYLYRPTVQPAVGTRIRGTTGQLVTRELSARSLFTHCMTEGDDSYSSSQFYDDRLQEAGRNSVEPSEELLVFSFLGDEMTLKSPADWNRASKPKLFLYNVHYFDDLNARDATKREHLHDSLIERWIDENPIGMGNGWEPYPLSLRIVNWVKFFSRKQSVPAHWLNSLASQAHFLSKRLEYHLLGNHLFTNAKALVFAGCYLDEADNFLETGLSILRNELPEQVLDDGAHFELSPMYHCIAMADLLDLTNLASAYPGQIPASRRQQWESTVNAMNLWLNHMIHPDGEISLFNDAALDIAPGAEELQGYAKAQSLSLADFDEPVYHAALSGYVAVKRQEIFCIMDVGRIGPDYIPGHAHADSLSFELSLFDQRLICNSGTSEYGTGMERRRQRGTAAHNTVVINSEDSSEVWGGFRVARRAYPRNVTVRKPESGSDGLMVSAEHTGYRRLKGRNIHSRKWLFEQAGITITDTITGKFDTAVAYLHLHPAVHVECSNNEALLVLDAGQRVRLTVQGGCLSIEPSTWHPRFGASIPNRRIAIDFNTSEVITRIWWNDDRADT